MTTVQTSFPTQFHGLVDYSRGMQLQANGGDCIHGLEHPAVITLGIRGKRESDVLWSPVALAARGIDCVQTERGGQATLHSPGQLVIYPCLDIRAMGIGPRAFVETIQRATRLWLRDMDVEARCGLEEPGLFVGDQKLVAFGFHISRGRTRHGLAINVANDLALFDSIRACGARGQPLARLADFGVSQSLEALFSSWCVVALKELALARPCADSTLDSSVAPHLQSALV